MTKDYVKIAKALELAELYGGVNGEQHKAWVIDSMVRALCGSKQEYYAWVARYEYPDIFGERVYKWDVGIVP